ncbi:MAG: hypothetical protein ACRYHQ_29645 [Janthinobacterium lividum]
MPTLLLFPTRLLLATATFFLPFLVLTTFLFFPSLCERQRRDGTQKPEHSQRKHLSAVHVNILQAVNPLGVPSAGIQASL